MKKQLIFTFLGMSLGVGFLSSPSLFNNQKSHLVSAAQIYQLGNRLEAEDHNYENCSLIDNNPRASNGVALDAGDGGYVTFNFTLELAGTYDLAIGYYTGNTGTKIGVEVNGSPKESLITFNSNGWCKDTSLSPVEYLHTVTLLSGDNSITVHSDNIGEEKYLNIDYIALVETFAADGSRIQAEKGSSFYGGNGYLSTYKVPDVCDNLVAKVDNDINAKPVYKINVPEAGEYVFQTAYYSATPAQYKFNFDQTNTKSETFNFASCPGGFPDVANGYCPFTNKANFLVTLEAGTLYLSFQYISNGYVDFDWFRLYKVNPAINETMEAEDYVYGDANVVKKQSDYSVLSGYAVELAQGNISFSVHSNEASNYRLYLGAYTATDGAYLNLMINGTTSKLTVTSKMATGWTGDVLHKNVMVFDISLNAGDNHIVITKGGDEVNMNYIDIDYIKIIKNNIKVTSLDLSIGVKPSIEIDTSILDFVTTYTLEVSNTNVAKLEGNTLVALENGHTTLFIKYEINGVSVVDELPINVSTNPYPNPEQLKAFNTTKSYNGELQYVDVEMPEGWTFQQFGASANVGTYVVKVVFSHPHYQDVVRYPITLTIEKAVYTGNELFADDATFEYDGEEHTYNASAPVGWTITYSENIFQEIGEYDVTVTFSHESYEDVVKTCKVKVIKATSEKESDNGFGVIMAVIGGVVSAGLLAFAITKIVKKYRADHETIK